MKCNVGPNDAFWRAVIGVTVCILGWYFREWWGFLGLVLIITAMICFCPLYRLFHHSSFKEDTGAKQDKGDLE